MVEIPGRPRPRGGAKTTHVSPEQLDTALCKLFDADFLTAKKVVPFTKEGGKVKVAVDGPVDPAILFEIGRQLDLPTVQVRVESDNLRELLSKATGRRVEAKRQRRFDFSEPIAFAIREKPDQTDDLRFHMATALNLSEGGTLFRIEDVPRGLRVKARLMIRIRVASDAAKMIDIPGTVRRIFGDEDGYFQVGVSFEAVSPESLRILRLQLISLQMPGGR